MTILDYVKKEISNMKGKSRKERWEYFLDYYKWHAIAVLLVIVLLIQGIVGAINRKEVIFSGILLNCKIEVKDEDFLNGFYDYAGINADKEEAAFYTGITITDGKTQNNTVALQRILAGIAVKETDFIIGPPDAFHACAYTSSQIFADLRDVLDEDTLKQFEDRIYYIDGDILQQLSAPPGTEVNVDLTKSPDPHKPETMKDPIPVGIDISDREAFQTAYYLPETVLYFGIVTNTTRPALVLQFIDYLFP